jgi:hypothetical protein
MLLRFDKTGCSHSTVIFILTDYEDYIRMNMLSRSLAKAVLKELLLEAKSPKKIIVVYPGSFQPFHKNHYEVYKWLCNKFGADSVFVGTTNVSTDRSVFSFQDKKKIMTTMFGISTARIVQIKNPYGAEEILKRFDPSMTVHISAIGGKDASRITKGKYYQPYNSSLTFLPYGKNKGYYLETPTFNNTYNGQLISGTLIRETFSNPKVTKEERIDLFKALYNKFDKSIYDLFVRRFGIKENTQRETDVLLEEVCRELGLLQEGGGAGHMLHPFEDMDLTFDDMAQMITLGLQGGFSTKELQEKLDGQNIMVSWIDGELKAARNKGHIKDFGASALNTSQVSDMFAGRGPIHDAFTYAMEDLSSAIGKLGEKDKKKIFGNGKKFANLEVLYPATQNVIPYGVSMLKFHNVTEYDREGNATNTDAAGASKLAAMIAKTNANVQKTFTIAGPSSITLQKSQDFSKKQPAFLAKLNQLKSKFHLSGADPVMKYHEEWWRSFVEKKARSVKYAIPEQVLGKLVNRWAFGDKSYSVADVKKEIVSESFKAWVLDYDKNDVALQLKQNIEPFERLFLQVGAEILSNASGLLASNPDAAVQKLKTDLDTAANDIKLSGDINKLAKLKQQLQRLRAVGGVSKIAPTEGIVFNYKGKLYKLTGTYAPINQLLGIMKFN